jgi:pSer/pThr/pTyr-binding forkhead associated (FHA) protein
MPRLIAQSEEFSGKTFELSGPTLTVGRVADNALQIDHNSVSGHHAELILEGKDYKVRDLDSTNGTRVNSERITEQKLRRNDIIRFGNIELLYDSEFSAPAQALPEPSQRVSLNDCVSKGKPASFINSSPFPKGRHPANKKWMLIILVLVLLAIGAVGYFFYRVFLGGA